MAGRKAITNRLLSWTVNGMTQKIQVATHEQLNGGFQWFDSDSNRICTDTGGSAAIYWISSQYSPSNVWLVRNDGVLGNNDPLRTYGFRPFVTLSF